MKKTYLAAATAIVLAATFGVGHAALSINIGKPKVTPVLTTGSTILGQPVVYPEGTALVTSTIVTLEPGAQTGWHSHEVPLYGYILQGTLTVDYGERATRTYRAGAGFMEAVNWPHNGMNLGDTPVSVLTFAIGTEGAPVSTPEPAVTETTNTR